MIMETAILDRIAIVIVFIDSLVREMSKQKASVVAERARGWTQMQETTSGQDQWHNFYSK